MIFLLILLEFVPQKLELVEMMKTFVGCDCEEEKENGA